MSAVQDKTVEAPESEIVTTTKGDMDTALLHKRTIITEDENELTHVIEYWLGTPPEDVTFTSLVEYEEMVHRSVHVQLKKNVAIMPDIETEKV